VDTSDTLPSRSAWYLAAAFLKPTLAAALSKSQSRVWEAPWDEAWDNN